MEVIFETVLVEALAVAVRLIVQQLIEWWEARSATKTFAIP